MKYKLTERLIRQIFGVDIEVSPWFWPMVLLFSIAAYLVLHKSHSNDDLMMGGFIMFLGALVAVSLLKPEKR